MGRPFKILPENRPHKRMQLQKSKTMFEKDREYKSSKFE